jgi:4-hydroxybenzoate polyprenyltransferase
VHPFPSVLLAGVVFALALIAGGRGEVGTAVELAAGMLCFQFAIGLINDVVDAEADATAKPWKPVASGAFPRRAAAVLGAGLAGLGLAVTLPLGATAWYIGLGGLLCGLSYDLWFKRTVLSWLPYAVALPLVPAWAYTAVGEWDGLLWWAFPIGALFGLSLYLANTAPDIEADLEAGVEGAAHGLGSRRAARLAVALYGVAGSAAALVILSRSAGHAAVVAAVVLAAGLVALRMPGRFGPNGLFGVLAAACAAIAIAFLASL